MPNNLGRDQLWNPQIWSVIDKAVQEEVGRIRVGQKVFPTVKTPGAANVPADQYNAAGGGTLTMNEGVTRPFIELSFAFQLTQAQIDNEADLQTARKLARRAARSMAQAEDRLLLQGNVALPAGVNARNAALAGNGLVDFANWDYWVNRVPPPRQGWREITFQGVTWGIAALTNSGHPGPYALLLSTGVFADAQAPEQNMPTTAERLMAMITGGFYQAGEMLDSRALLVSLGGEPTTLYLAQDATLAFNQQDANGNYRFRVFERFQYVAREAEAFVRLRFA
jgi:uncharacterized linocin/CFP29 family protein